MLPENMKAAGMELQPTTTDFATLQNAMLHATDTQYNMYNLATGFATANSPWYYFSNDEAWMGNYNTNWIADQELNDAVVPMKSIPYDDHEAGWKPGRTSSRCGTRSCPTSPCTPTSTTISSPPACRVGITPLPGAGRTLFWTLGSPSNF